MELGPRVQAALDGFLAAQSVRLGEVADDVSPLLDELAALASGGKRLRASLCYWAFRAYGGADDAGPDAPIVRAAASLELLQACALAHDDVMDASSSRRGRPSAHRTLAGLHRRERWVGDPEEFGSAAAVLLGDLALAWSDEMFRDCGLPPGAVEGGRPAYDRMRSEAVAGQYLDLVGRARAGGGIGDALRVVTYKTVCYTVDGPLHLGAALAGSPEPAGLSAFGVPLGEAFQLRDDLLGTFGDPAVTGKPAGDDLRAGTRSVLLAVGAARGAMLDGAGDPALDEAGVRRLRTALAGCGAVDAVEGMIAERRGRALDALTALRLEPTVARALHDLAVASVDRVA